MSLSPMLVVDWFLWCGEYGIAIFNVALLLFCCCCLILCTALQSVSAHQILLLIRPRTVAERSEGYKIYQRSPGSCGHHQKTRLTNLFSLPSSTPILFVNKKNQPSNNDHLRSWQWWFANNFLNAIQSCGCHIIPFYLQANSYQPHNARTVRGAKRDASKTIMYHKKKCHCTKARANNLPRNPIYPLACVRW